MKKEKVTKEKVTKVVLSLASRKMLKESRKGLKSFYLDTNFDLVRKTLADDKAFLKNLFPAVSNPAVAPVKKETTSTLGLLKKQTGKTGQPVSVVMVASKETSDKFAALKFFDLYCEAESQKLMERKFHDTLFSSEKEKAKYKEFISSVSAIEALIVSGVKAKGLSEIFNAEIGKRKKVILELQSLIEKTK